MRKPWFRESDGWWYVTRIVDGKRRHVRLSQDEKEAIDEWHKIERAPRVDADEPMLVALFDAHLLWALNNQPTATYDWKRRYILPFSCDLGQLVIGDAKPYHLTKWLDDAALPSGARRATITAIKTALNWCVEQGLIKYNPLAKVKRPAAGRREQLVDSTVRNKILRSTDAPFRLLVTALAQTGCRPGEARTVDAAKFDENAATWVFPVEQHKTGEATGRKRVVHLSPCMVTLCRILATSRPSGPLFLNARGKAWTGNAVRIRMDRLRNKHALPAGTVAYSFRHTFTTDGLSRGVSGAMMAEILGHRDMSMIDRHYGHLDQRSAAVKEALAQASKPAGPLAAASSSARAEAR